jgi:hypothetical protein
VTALYVLTLFTLTPKGLVQDRQLAVYQQPSLCEVVRWRYQQAYIRNGKFLKCLTIFSGKDAK